MNGFKRKVRRTVAAALVALLLLTGSALPAVAEAFSAIVTSKTMRVYADVSMTEALGELQKNAVVRVMGYSNTIAKKTANKIAHFIHLGSQPFKGCHSAL